MRVSEKTKQNSERLGWQARPGFKPGTSRLPVLSVTTPPLVGRQLYGSNRNGHSKKKRRYYLKEGLERYGLREIEAKDKEQWEEAKRWINEIFCWRKPHWGNSWWKSENVHESLNITSIQSNCFIPLFCVKNLKC